MTPAGRRIETLLKLAVIAFMVYPLLPDARTRWYLAMRGCQEAARRFGTLAIVAENHYRQEIA